MWRKISFTIDIYHRLALLCFILIYFSIKGLTSTLFTENDTLPLLGNSLTRILAMRTMTALRRTQRKLHRPWWRNANDSGNICKQKQHFESMEAFRRIKFKRKHRLLTKNSYISARKWKFNLEIEELPKKKKTGLADNVRGQHSH